MPSHTDAWAQPGLSAIKLRKTERVSGLLDTHSQRLVYRGYMKDTTVKVSTETRERIRAMGGATHEDTIVEALDALESERFWAEAEQGKKWFDSLSNEQRQRLREEDDAIDALFKGI